MAERTTIVALYDTPAQAEGAINDLVEHGYPRETINLITNDVSLHYEHYVKEMDLNVQEKQVDTDNTDDPDGGEGAAFGAVIGTLTGLGVATIPGIGPVLAIGPWATALVSGIGAASGATTGGIVASITDLGADEDEAHVYAEGVKRGGVLVAMHTMSEYEDKATTILERYDPVDIDARGESYRDEDWMGWNEQDEPYTPAQVNDYRERYSSMAAQQDYEDKMRSRRYVRDEVYEPFTMYEPYYKEHFGSAYAGAATPYEAYRPAYYYGYNLATHPQYHDMDWKTVEPYAREYWFSNDDDSTWDQVKHAVQEGWQRVRSTVKA